MDSYSMTGLTDLHKDFIWDTNPVKKSSKTGYASQPETYFIYVVRLFFFILRQDC